MQTAAAALRCCLLCGREREKGVERNTSATVTRYRAKRRIRSRFGADLGGKRAPSLLPRIKSRRSVLRRSISMMRAQSLFRLLSGAAAAKAVTHLPPPPSLVIVTAINRLHGGGGTAAQSVSRAKTRNRTEQGREGGRQRLVRSMFPIHRVRSCPRPTILHHCYM